MIEIIPFEAKYADDFIQINLEWLDANHFTEPHDLLQLEHAQTEIIDKGGCIFLAKEGEQIVGSAALAYEGDGVYELAKMGVRPAFQGRGISKLLLEACLQAAKNLNAKKVILFSNSKLTTAITLYGKYGFKHVPVADSHFTTADVKMELSLAHK
ncbi:MAG TPA: GNAT family N-acetyltransferase [Chitinophagaceae bacterium]|nr:GNAT family N-acetyltransferase [Chitinophagaceae bacterium]